MRRIIITALVLSAVTANAQVKDGMIGINTDEPRATMHIEPGVSESKGLIIPRITAAQMKTMTNLAHFGADHHAIITYLKEQMPTADRTGKLVDVAEPGYYYYDNTTGVQKWKTFGGGGEQDFKALPTVFSGQYNYLTKGAGIGGNGTSLGTGVNNIGIGTGSFKFANSSDMTGNQNIGMGISVFEFPNGGTMWSNSNIGIGGQSYTFSNGGSMGGSGFNIALGTAIYRFSKSNAQFTGNNNTGIGQGVFNITAGDFSGNDNIGIGGGVMNASQGIAGDYNIALGREAMTTGGKIAGTNNIAIGYRAIWPVNTDIGSYNIGIGNWALNGGMARGNANIQIGNWDVGPLVPGELNRVVAIGNEMTGLDTTNTDNNVILLGRNSLSGARVGVGTYQPKARLDVAGSIKVGNDGSTCTSDNVGTIRFVGNHFYGCDGTTWKQLDN